MNTRSDTIAAIATPPGPGGIAILRISGQHARVVLQRLFRFAGATKDGAFTFRPRFMHFGHAIDEQGQSFDDVLAVYMPGPNSATGEDVGEIHCHGGPGITSALLEAAFAAGARLAEPGEFTRRAFLNGRMDLTQAEAVAEIIAAATTRGARLAKAKLEGGLGAAVRRIRGLVDACRVQITLSVDFPDEGAELLAAPAFASSLAEASAELASLLAAFERARLWREGVTVVLAGRVNAGKSSLFNIMVGRKRAIVSPQPGTTRDFIEESISLKGMPVRLIDTAGLRTSGDDVEEEGIRLAGELAAGAHVLLLVIDAAVGMAAADEAFMAQYTTHAAGGRLLVVMNKLDAISPATRQTSIADCPAFYVSALAGTGVEELLDAIYVVAVSNAELEGEVDMDIAPNLRQSQLLREARVELEALSADLAAGLPPDILGVRLDAAVHSLDEVVGLTDSEGILDRIFSSFCIGK